MAKDRRVGGAILVLAASGVMLYIYLSVKHTADRMYQPLPIDQSKYVARDPELKPLQESKEKDVHAATQAVSDASQTSP